MKIFKYTLYLLFFLAVFFIPLYGAGRLILPEYLKKELLNNLPKGSTLKIGSINSELDLGIIFENVHFKSNNENLILVSPKIKFSPRLSMSNPLKISSDELYLKGTDFKSSIKNLHAGVLFSNKEASQISILGEIDELKNADSMIFSQLEFFLEGINAQNKNIDLKAASINFAYENEYGSFVLNGKNLRGSGVFNEEPSIALNLDDLYLDMSKLILESDNRIIYSNSGTIELNFIKNNNWSIPIKINLQNSKTPIEELGEKISLLTSINWAGGNANCNYLDLFKSTDDCGVPRDFLNSSIVIEDSKQGLVKINGNGFCVTPLSNCTQRIEATIRSKKTAQIFSKIMVSGFINPLLGGVILSGLLTNPDNTDVNFDHKVKIDVLGSKILLNNKPLI